MSFGTSSPLNPASQNTSTEFASRVIPQSMRWPVAKQVTGPAVIKSFPGTKRAVLALTDAVCMTFHRVDSCTVEDAEAELVEDDPTAMFAVGNKVATGVLKHQPTKVIE
jgi:hypothetical protein